MTIFAAAHRVVQEEIVRARRGRERGKREESDTERQGYVDRYFSPQPHIIRRYKQNRRLYKKAQPNPSHVLQRVSSGTDLVGDEVDAFVRS